MYYPYVPHSRQPEPDLERRTLRVTGEGSVSVQPDIARIQLEVITENVSLSQAQQENAQIMSRVIDALLNLGIERGNIQTTAFNITPRYDFIDGQQVFRGYEVRNQITVEVTAIDQVGNIIDVAVQTGVNRVSNIQFTVQNRQLYYQQALVSALENAREKAQTINETMQLNLDPTPIRIVERVIDTPITYNMLTLAAETFTTPIEPGEIVIMAKVEVQFRY
ncbi:SIMPL domain-containing protein [Oceanobacillus saliphilus]|uniref:SIMPL domain-containing protein n=1 Tax=Oceanobacillus saliphilus TaxID=2925834 RepID=UPI00201D6D81|nr:SIMPL domain-containing protein [Oceanobacillus saliphilus]